MENIKAEATCYNVFITSKTISASVSVSHDVLSVIRVIKILKTWILYIWQ